MLNEGHVISYHRFDSDEIIVCELWVLIFPVNNKYPTYHSISCFQSDYLLNKKFVLTWLGLGFGIKLDMNEWEEKTNFPVCL